MLDAVHVRAQARSEGEPLRCELGEEAALVLKARLQSSLVRARVLMHYQFVDAAGEVLLQGDLPPVIGQFRDLDIEHQLTVPPAARHLQLQLRAHSRSPEGSGSLQLSGLQLLASAPVRLQAEHSVYRPEQPLSLKLQVAEQADGARIQMRLLDLEGRERLRLPSQTLKSGAHMLRVPGQPVGYYRLAVQVEHAQLAMPHLEQSLLVLPPMPAAAEPRIGLDTALSWYGGDAAARADAIALLRAVGVGSVRDRFSWSQVQRQADAVDWGRYLQVARELHAAGLQTTQVFHDVPPWARLSAISPRQSDAASLPLQERTPPHPRAAFALGQHYARQMGPYAAYVEFWNEQNSSFFAGYPWEYAQALKAFAAGVQATGKDVTVLMGAAAGQPGAFFESIYRNRPGPAFAAHNQHFYGKLDDLPTFTAGLQRQWQAEGLAHKPAWLTEIGYSLQRDARGQWEQAEREQVAHLLRAYGEGLAAGYERVFYFLLRDLIEDDYHTWGLLRADGTPRPAVQALGMLTRHLHGAQPWARLRTPQLQVLYFRHAAGDFRALAWGKAGLKALGPFRSARDAMGRPLAAAARLSAEPVLLDGVTPPAAATSLRRPPAAVGAEAVGTGLRLAASLSINGAAAPRPVPRQFAVPVSAGQSLRLTAQLDGLTLAQTAQLRCLGGPGITISQPDWQTVQAGVDLPCDYQVGPAATPSWIAIEARQDGRQDRLHIDLQLDRRRALQTLSAAGRARSVPLCQSWSRNAAAGMQLDIAPQGEPDACRGVRFRSLIQRRGESWAFPATALVGTSLQGVAAVHIELAAVPGTAFPPRPFILQLVEQGGAIWVLDLQQEASGDGRYRASGLLRDLRPAPWSTVKADAPRLERVRQFMLGWGGYGGLPGQRHAWQVVDMQLIAATPAD